MCVALPSQFLEANLPIKPYEDVLAKCPAGVYYGWANVDKGTVYKMAMSIGWSPFYKNKEKTMEIHIIHKFEDDFYGAELRAVVVGYIRGEANFKNVDDLIKAIQDDIKFSEQQLDSSDNDYQKHPFLTT